MVWWISAGNSLKIYPDIRKNKHRNEIPALQKSVGARRESEFSYRNRILILNVLYNSVVMLGILLCYSSLKIKASPKFPNNEKVNHKFIRRGKGWEQTVLFKDSLFYLHSVKHPRWRPMAKFVIVLQQYPETLSGFIPHFVMCCTIERGSLSRLSGNSALLEVKT